jgi:hypothetical protein
MQYIISVVSFVHWKEIIARSLYFKHVKLRVMAIYFFLFMKNLKLNKF